eukprot:11069102-Alexandrium_andersonii.AAC.1
MISSLVLEVPCGARHRQCRALVHGGWGCRLTYGVRGTEKGPRCPRVVGSARSFLSLGVRPQP